jgi:hypothetical protein
MLMSVEKLVARLVFGQLAGELAMLVMFGVDEVGEEWVWQ